MLLGRHRYWFADTILEMWATLHEENGRGKEGGLSSTGTFGVVPVYRRGAALIEKCGTVPSRRGKSWTRRLAFNYSSVSITNGRFRVEEIQACWASHVMELKLEQAKERQERDKERQDWDKGMAIDEGSGRERTVA